MAEALISLQGLFEVLPDAVVVVDAAGRIAMVNPAVQRLLEFDPAELIGKPHTVLIPERFRARHEREIERFRASGRPTAMTERPVLPALNRAGAEVPVSIAVATLDAGGVTYAVAVLRDAAPMRDRLNEARSQAQIDSLTQIGNRRFLLHRLRVATEAGRPFGLLFLDLTRFKRFNDRHGHHMGDEVLRIVAQRLRSARREGDAVARVGGDEFVLLLAGLADRKALLARASALADHLCEPMHVAGRIVEIGVNIGGALYPHDGRDEIELLETADRRMYEAKRAGLLFRAEGAPGHSIRSE